MNYYAVSVQFASPDAPAFDQIEDQIDSAIHNYNLRSLIAKNPKRIRRKTITDSKTLDLILESEAKLSYPGKALKLLSVYLLEHSSDKSRFQELVVGTQLFKMTSKPTTDPARQEQFLFRPLDLAMKLEAIELILRATESELTRVLEVFGRAPN